MAEHRTPRDELKAVGAFAIRDAEGNGGIVTGGQSMLAEVVIDAVLANPGVVLRALGAVKCWHPQGITSALVPHWWFPIPKKKDG